MEFCGSPSSSAFSDEWEKPAATSTQAATAKTSFMVEETNLTSRLSSINSLRSTRIVVQRIHAAPAIVLRDGLGHERLGLLHGFLQGQTLRQSSGNGCGKRAAGAVGVHPMDAAVFQP